MSSLNWTKSYDLIVANKNFQILISEHDGNQFYASCLWYEGDRVLKAPGEEGCLNIHLEKRFSNSEEDALNQLLDWVKTKFGEEFKLNEK